MKLYTRKRIFYVFLLLFIVISVTVVLYAEGWRINLKTGLADKAGGIYVRSYPSDAQILLDGNPVQNQSAFLSRGTFISELTPKTYTLQLKENGYDAWTEQAQVIPSLVAEMKYAVLVPQTGINVATSQNVKAFFEVDGQLVTQNTNDILLWNGASIGKGTIISHSANLKTAIVRSSSTNPGATVYWFYDFQNSTSSNLTPLLKELGIIITPQLNIFIDPYNDTNILIQTNNKIFSIDSGTMRVADLETAPLGETIGTPIAISPSMIAWARYNNATNLSQIIVYDKFSGNIDDDSLVVAGSVKQLSSIKNNTLGVLEDNNSLYLYKISSQQLTKLADDVKQFYPTTDGNTIAALEYHSVEVFAFSTSDYYRFNIPQTEDILGLTWYKDMTHLFVTYPDHVSFLDLVDTNVKNLITISQGTLLDYDQQENSLYLIDPAQHLLRFDFPQ